MKFLFWMSQYLQGKNLAFSGKLQSCCVLAVVGAERLARMMVWRTDQCVGSYVVNEELQGMCG
jgi:hypothetical protein